MLVRKSVREVVGIVNSQNCFVASESGVRLRT